MDAKKKEPSFLDVAKFLLGEGELDGVWFGDDNPNCVGRYWWRTYLRAALAQPAQGEVKFLLNGARLKLSFQQEECESCGASSAHFRTVPLDQYADELQGRWVALVAADNDRHLTQPPADTIAVPMTEYEAMKRDAERLNAIQENSWDLRSIDLPTGGDDSEIGWQVIEHHQAAPHEHVIGTSYNDDARAAIDAAIKSTGEDV